MKNRTKNYTIVLFLLVFMLSAKVSAQITLIPDSNFEQNLIDQGIDSDGELNGQVLTSDVNTVVELSVGFNVVDLTGIEDFTNLEVFTTSGGSLEIVNFSNNLSLREVWIFPPDQSFANNLTHLDLSNNINLEFFFGKNMTALEALNLKNGNNEALEVVLICVLQHKGCDLILDCVQVDNAEAATNGEGGYSNWSIQSEDFEYSEDCEELGITDINYTTIKLYPNPVGDQLVIQSNTRLESAIIYSVTGALVKEVPIKADTSINVQDLTQGLYFVRLDDKKGRLLTKKFIKQ